MIVKPFRGLRPRADLADRIPSYPYDVVSSDEARELVRDDPYSFLHVVKPEIDLDPRIDPYDDRVYARGRENFRRMVEQGWLERDPTPSYYVYRLVWQGEAQIGILGAAAIADYTEDRIKKHEHTRPEKENDRVRLNEALSANPGPVFLTYAPLPELNALVNGLVARAPAAGFTAADGVEHALWVVDEPAAMDKIAKLLGATRRAYVADGHHRAAAAARVGAERAARLEEPTGEEPCHYFLAAYFPADQLRVLDYNRVVADLNGLDPESFLARVRKAGFHVDAQHRTRRPPHSETFGMYLAGSWYLLTAGADVVDSSDVVQRLDVSILTDRLLQPILGIGDPRTDRRIDFVGGIRGMDELERRVDSGRDAVAFALHPTSLRDVMDVADAGQVMPPKSTWFEPKLRSGMVVQLLDGDRL
jgi:uncharacterized protein (DUF1015 family)